MKVLDQLLGTQFSRDAWGEYHTYGEQKRLPCQLQDSGASL
jgi:hypothetical protein